MRPNRFTLLLAAIVALGAVACEPHRSPDGGATEITKRVDERGVLLLDGLGDLGPHIQAAMGTAEDRAARAPYSPEGWPLQRGDVIDIWYSVDLDNEFPPWGNVHNVYWVGMTAFGARWDSPGTENADGLPDARYIGHFPQKINYTDWWKHIPFHLRTLNPVILQDTLYEPVYGHWDHLDSLKGVWTVDAWLEGYTGDDER